MGKPPISICAVYQVSFHPSKDFEPWRGLRCLSHVRHNPGSDNGGHSQYNKPRKYQRSLLPTSRYDRSNTASFHRDVVLVDYLKYLRAALLI